MQYHLEITDTSNLSILGSLNLQVDIPEDIDFLTIVDKQTVVGSC